MTSLRIITLGEVFIEVGAEKHLVKQHPKHHFIASNIHGEVFAFRGKKWNRFICKKTDNGYERMVIVNPYTLEQHKFYIHRLIAETWIDNSGNKPCVDHINRIRNDNRVCNLRWVTKKENNGNKFVFPVNNFKGWKYNAYENWKEEVVQQYEKHFNT